MACRLVGAKPNLNQSWNIVNSNLRNKLQWNSKRNPYIFIKEDPCENVVWKKAAILSRPQCVIRVSKTRPSLVQIMDYHLFGTKLLSEPKLAYCQLDPLEQTFILFYVLIKIQIFSFKKLYFKLLPERWWPFLLHPLAWSSDNIQGWLSAAGEP